MRKTIINSSLGKGNEILRLLSSVISKEADVLKNLALNVPLEAANFVEKILSTKGKLIFTGLGKSWHISQKLAATFSSLGIPSLALHANNAVHGDLGIIQSHDSIVIISKSAYGSEFEYIIELAKKSNIHVSLICCSYGNLCKTVDLVIRLCFREEACVMNLAPTSSTTLFLAFGDAIAVVLSYLRNFTKADFMHFHPAGSIGKKLTSTVAHFMYKGDTLPIIYENTLFVDLICVITKKKLGVGIVVDEKNKVKGIITDGDLRRACKYGSLLFNKTAEDIMTKNPKVIAHNLMAIDALEIMESYNITSLIVQEFEQIVGIIHIHDLIKAGIN